MRLLRWFGFAACTAVAAMTPGATQAATIDWNATASDPSPGTDWMQGTNWVGGIVPGSNDVANFARWNRANQPNVGANQVEIGGIRFDNFGGTLSPWMLNGTAAGTVYLGANGLYNDGQNSDFYPTIAIASPTSTWAGRNQKILHEPLDGTGTIYLAEGQLQYPLLDSPPWRGALHVMSDSLGTDLGGDVATLNWEPHDFTSNGVYNFGSNLAGTEPATITVNGINPQGNGSFSVNAYPGGAASNNVRFEVNNPIAVGPMRGGLHGRQWQVSGIDPQIRFSGPIDLGGILATGDGTASTRGNDVQYTGTVTIRNTVPALAGFDQFSWVQDSDFSGDIVDGPGDYANPLVLTTEQRDPVLSSSNNTYAAGTRVAFCGWVAPGDTSRARAGFVVRSWTKLGSGDVEIVPGGMLKMESGTAVDTGATLRVCGDALSLGVAGVGDNTLPTLASDSDGVFAIDTGGYDLITDLSTLGDGTMFLGACNAAGTLTSVSLAAGAGNVYRLGGGGNTLTIANSVLTGTAALEVGSLRYHGGGTVVLSTSNTFSGAIEVWEPLFHYGATRGTTLRANTVSTNSSHSALGDATADVTLHGAQLWLMGQNTWAEAVKGDLTFESDAIVIADRNNSGGNAAQLRFDNLVRTNRGTLVVQGYDSLLGHNTSNEFVRINNPPSLTNGIAPPYIVARDTQNDYVADFATYDATLGFHTNGVYASLDLESSTAADVVSYAGAITGTRECYALKATGDITGTGQKITIHGGGLILPDTGADRDILPDIDFGSAEGIIYVADDIWELKGIVSGSGGITKSGVDTVELQNPANDFTGLITVNRGDLGFFFDDLYHGTAGSMGDVNNDVYLNGGRLYMLDGATTNRGLLASRTVTLGPLGGSFREAAMNNREYELAGKITGPGPLIFDLASGNGNVAVNITNPSNDYSGGTYIYGTYVDAEDGGKFGNGPVLVQRNTRVRVYHNEAFATSHRVTVAIDGLLYFPTDAPVLGSLDGSGTVILGEAIAHWVGPDVNADLRVGADNSDCTWHGIITEPYAAAPDNSEPSSSLTKIGTGTWTITGPQFFDGVTTVSNGALRLDGSVQSNVVVEANGTLMGSGHIGGSLIMNGTYRILLDGETFKPMQVDGAAILNGDIEIVVAEGFHPVGGTVYTLLTADGGISGAFTGVLGGYPVTVGPNSLSLRVPSGLLLIVR